MPSAEIITIGTEILLGEIVDTNTRYIARTLRGLGVDLYRTSTIGDNVERIAEAIRHSMTRADIIITTGGLGPTVDDPTREAVARAFGVETEFREELWEQIRAIVTRYGREAAENQKRQAYVPEGAIAIKNSVGTAPSFIKEKAQSAVISLPGVPKEMEHLLHEAVIPYLQKRYNLNQVIKVRLLHTAGAGESEIDEQIGEFETLANPTVGLAAHTGIVDIRIAAKAETEAEADHMIADVENQMRERLGTLVFGADEDTLEAVALKAASDRAWNLVAVESGLSGALTRRLARALASNLLEVEATELEPGELPAFLKSAQEKHNANAAFGIAAYPDKRIIELILITPDESRTRQLSFGGHPALIPRWAINNTLNWLRRTAEGCD
ncbi:MAG: CinA family nicotinamide mononucleotide deamidase-related protein [Anaerolineales bacterium]|jgi:competence/damage-inducible protein CinA-like protein